MIPCVISSDLLTFRVAEIGKRRVGRAAAYRDWTAVAINRIIDLLFTCDRGDYDSI